MSAPRKPEPKSAETLASRTVTPETPRAAATASLGAVPVRSMAEVTVTKGAAPVTSGVPQIREGSWDHNPALRDPESPGRVLAGSFDDRLIELERYAMARDNHRLAFACETRRQTLGMARWDA